MNLFKIGDVITYIGINEMFRGSTKVVTDVVGNFIAFNHAVQGCSHYRDYYANWTFHSHPKSELEKLVEEANKGTDVAIRLENEYHDKLERVKVDQGSHFSQYFIKYKIKHKPTFTPFLVGDVFKVRMAANRINLGCMSFDPQQLKTVLTELCNGKYTNEVRVSSSSGVIVLSASRAGISYKGDSITWADAEKILAALKEIE